MTFTTKQSNISDADNINLKEKQLTVQYANCKLINLSNSTPNKQGLIVYTHKYKSHL